MQHVLRNHDRLFFPPGKVLEMITIDAARALGMDREIGSLEPSKKADIVVVDRDQPHLTPDWMPVHRLIHQAIGADVDMVMMDDRILMASRVVAHVNETEAPIQGGREAAALLDRTGAQVYRYDSSWGHLYRIFDVSVPLPHCSSIR